MTKVHVVSTALSTLEYDAIPGTLRIWFRDGGLHEYHGVPKDVYELLLTARSCGGYFRQNIRGKYDCMKLR